MTPWDWSGLYAEFMTQTTDILGWIMPILVAVLAIAFTGAVLSFLFGTFGVRPHASGGAGVTVGAWDSNKVKSTRVAGGYVERSHWVAGAAGRRGHWTHEGDVLSSRGISYLDETDDDEAGPVDEAGFPYDDHAL